MVMIMGGVLGVWKGETVLRRCDSSQGGVKVVRNVFQSMERYDGHGGDVRGCGKVLQLSGIVTVLSEV